MRAGFLIMTNGTGVIKDDGEFSFEKRNQTKL